MPTAPIAALAGGVSMSSHVPSHWFDRAFRIVPDIQHCRVVNVEAILALSAARELSH